MSDKPSTVTPLEQRMLEDIESLSAKFHEIYQQEAKRQGDVRHKDAYADLPENVKEFDRVLARHVLALLTKEVKAAVLSEWAWFDELVKYHNAFRNCGEDSRIEGMREDIEQRIRDLEAK